jgi:hypothetical protein
VEAGSHTLDAFKATSQRLQDEAIANTQIIEELAGLEKYISETYVSRVFYEIIQNADDCASTKFHAFMHEGAILLFNNGHIFSDRDLESLCRSAFSSKQRGVNIGYRGIGFKSVAGVCKAVTVISGQLEVFFSKEKTHELIARQSRVPLLRIPHLGSADRDLSDIAKSYMTSHGMQTCIILHDADSTSLLNDLRGLNRAAIAFLRNLLEIDIKLTSYSKKISAERIRDSEKKIGEISQRDLIVATSSSSEGKETSVQHSIRIWNYRKIGICTDLKDAKPVRLKKTDAYAQAFLPMLTTTGLGARINGDFSTDPSRTRINPDEYTRKTLDDLVELLFSLLDRLCDGSLSAAEQELLEILIPYRNASVFEISPSYISEQINSRISDAERVILSGFMLCPAWLKKTDYKKLAKAGRYKTLSFDQVGLGDYESFFLSMGATRPGLEKILELLSRTTISSSGIVSFWRNILEDLRITTSFKSIDHSRVSQAKLFICTDGIARSGREIATSDELEVDIIFGASLFDMAGRSTDAADLWVHCGISVSKIPATLLETIRSSLGKSSEAHHKEMLYAINSKTKATDTGSDSNSVTGKQKGLRLNGIDRPEMASKKGDPIWRSAERLAGALLLELGFDVEDVSKRNVGYDFTARKGDRNVYCVEVKKIDAPGDEFILTDNEIYVAKDLGERYWVLIIVQPTPEQHPTSYTIIKNFYNTFEKHMVRRCVKYQMFCSEYEADFRPLLFE